MKRRGGAATIGNAYIVETVWLQNSVVVGNTLNGAAEDWFAGSILDFYSQGYNLVDDFLNHVILQLRAQYGAILGSDFGSSFGDMTGTTWYGPAVTWPSNA